MISSWTFFRLVGGEVSGSQHHQPSGSNLLSGVYGLVGSTQLTPPTWWGSQYPQNRSKVLLCICLEAEPGPCPKAALLLLLTVPPLSPHPLPFMFSNCLNPPFGSQGKSWRLNEICFLLCPGVPQGPARFHS